MSPIPVPFRIALAALLATALAVPAPAYLYWSQPALKGDPVNGDEPGIALPLPGATPKEMKAGLLWSMRAGLNVAALQCQFSPGLMTVDNYNALLKQHQIELRGAYDSLSGYFKRTAGGATLSPPKGRKAAPKARVPDKVWQAEADSYTTRTYNSFSTLHAQLSFCETAASIGRDALVLPPGDLGKLASLRMREFRNSLIPVGDAGLNLRTGEVTMAPAPDLPCVNARGKEIKCKAAKR
jgi:hypothetical protein